MDEVVIFNNGLHALIIIAKYMMLAAKMVKEELDKIVDNALKQIMKKYKLFVLISKDKKRICLIIIQRQFNYKKQKVVNMQNTEGIKEAKFKLMVQKTSMWLNNTKTVEYYMPFNFPLKNYDNYYKDSYLKVVFDKVFANPKIGKKEGISVTEIDKAINYLNKKDTWCNVFNYKSEDLFDGYSTDYVLYKDYIQGSIIFWGLVMCAINKEFYDNEINMISDLAYLLGYTEDMVSDWVVAVKYFLDGNTFSSNMPVELKTAEANKFFKHK